MYMLNEEHIEREQERKAKNKAWIDRHKSIVEDRRELLIQGFDQNGCSFKIFISFHNQ